MKLNLVRHTFTDKSTIGSLSIDGIFESYTLEDVTRTGPKIPNETAIPYGTYRVALTYSSRFKRVLPILMDVPGFEGVRIHWGNKSDDTEGCILVGQTKSADFVGNSLVAFGAIYDKLYTSWLVADPITITIEKGGGNDQETSHVTNAV